VHRPLGGRAERYGGSRPRAESTPRPERCLKWPFGPAGSRSLLPKASLEPGHASPFPGLAGRQLAAGIRRPAPAHRITAYARPRAERFLSDGKAPLCLFLRPRAPVASLGAPLFRANPAGLKGRRGAVNLITKRHRLQSRYRHSPHPEVFRLPLTNEAPSAPTQPPSDVSFSASSR
jgi:hypothetical protein